MMRRGGGLEDGLRRISVVLFFLYVRPSMLLSVTDRVIGMFMSYVPRRVDRCMRANAEASIACLVLQIGRSKNQ